jgi:hypothetical protein
MAMLRADGTFEFNGVTPGRYTVVARATLPVAADRAANSGASYASVIASIPSFWAMADVTVDGNDVTSLALALQPTMTVSGRVVLRPGPQSGAVDLTRARISLSGVVRAAGGLGAGIPSATPAANGEFTIAGVLPGSYRIGGSIASAFDWRVTRAMHEGRDTLDFPIVVSPGASLTGVEVTMSDVTARLSGSLQDAAGRPASAFTIVVFPADRQYWKVARRVRTAKPGADGHYAVSDIPAGRYLIAAVVDLAPGESSNPALLEQLAASAVAVTIGDGEKKIQDLRIGGQ